MGTVYSASDLALCRDVAVKVLRDDLAGNGDAVERFEREARTAAGFSHPNVVTIHDFGVTAGGRAFLVMERLRGRTLREEMERRGALPPARVLDLVRGVCAAVDAAHRRRLVHRDLKPENVFLAEVEDAEIPKVLDFGIAKSVWPVPARGTRQTATGVMLGTPEYMAPEQLRGEEASPSWDIWALAVLTYELLTGTHPFSSIVVGRAEPGTAPGAGVGGAPATDERWAPFFEQALAIDPAARPPSAAVFSAGLERILLG
jgi:eukaryotic-like serine/threonine-protein kinase